MTPILGIFVFLKILSSIKTNVTDLVLSENKEKKNVMIVELDFILLYETLHFKPCLCHST